MSSKDFLEFTYRLSRISIIGIVKTQDVIRGRLEEERRTSEGEASDYRLRDCEVRAEYGARRGREVESAGTKLTKCIMWLPLPESTNF